MVTYKEEVEAGNKLMEEFKKLVPEAGRGKAVFQDDVKEEGSLSWVFYLDGERYTMTYLYKNKKVKIDSKK